MCRQSFVCLLDDAPCNARHIFRRRVWYRALSLCYARRPIRRSGIIHTLGYRCAKFRFWRPSPTTELARVEKSRTQSLSLTHQAYVPGTEAFASQFLTFRRSGLMAERQSARMLVIKNGRLGLSCKYDKV